MKNILFNKDGKATLENINMLAQTDVNKLVCACEDYYNSQLDEMCDKITSNENYKIVLISGPSGSGKTTTANKLSQRLEKAGKEAIYISLDDFFINRDNLPLLENGEKDFESINTLDIKEIRKCFSNMLSGKKATVPYFDFKTGKRDLSKSREIEIKENEIIIVEGLHALNSKLTDDIDSSGKNGFFKLYVNPQSTIFDESGKAILRKRELRLMRRMIRDYLFRGSSFENTLKMWEGVCREEIKSISAYKNTADDVIDTTHFYEFCVYHHFMIPIMEKSKVSKQKDIDELNSLKEKLDAFYDAPLSVIPEDSMIREFIGEV